MRPFTTTAFLAFAVGTACADDVKDAAKKLEGTYEVIDVLIGGKADPKKDEIKAVVIKGDELIIKGKSEDPAKFVLDPSKKPAHIDITVSGDLKIPGIYELKETDKGTELTIAMRLAPGAERPTDFKGAGKEEVLLKLLRKKPK